VIAPTATVDGDHAFIKVKINGLLHISIIRSELLSIQAWHVDDSLWQIEYCSKGGVKIRADYVTRDLWASILQGLDKLAIALD
jgi:hypothetical protein